jgi:hypothetical protein
LQLYSTALFKLEFPSQVPPHHILRSQAAGIGNFVLDSDRDRDSNLDGSESARQSYSRQEATLANLFRKECQGYETLVGSGPPSHDLADRWLRLVRPGVSTSGCSHNSRGTVAARKATAAAFNQAGLELMLARKQSQKWDALS